MIHNYSAAGAYIARDKIWKGRKELTVFFLNEEVIDEWRCGSSQMTVATIMAWAKTWNTSYSEEISKLKHVERLQDKEKADIRVKCKSKDMFIPLS